MWKFGYLPILFIFIDSRLFYLSHGQCNNNIHVATSSSGTIQSPNYPRPYPPNQLCVWEIRSTQIVTITLVFTKFELEIARNEQLCQYDSVEIVSTYIEKEINVTSEYKYGPFCGTRLPDKIQAGGMIFRITFISDSWNHFSGFSLSYSFAACGAKLVSRTGTIQSPNYPNPYPRNQKCIWDIILAENSKLTLTFTHFNLEIAHEVQRCKCDRIEVISTYVKEKRIDVISEKTKYGPFCGSQLPLPIYASGTVFRIIFTTDDSNQLSGFSATYSIVKDSCLAANGQCQSSCGNNTTNYDCIIDDYMPKINPAILNTRKAAMKWIKDQRQNVANQRWGNQVTRIAVTLFLANPTYFNDSNTKGNEIAYEVDALVLSNLMRNVTNPISDNQIAIYIHSLLVTCFDPANFYGINLISELRRRVNSQTNYSSPLAILALCNANDNMTNEDINKIKNVFNDSKRRIRTSTQALSLMALSCIAKKSHVPIVTSDVINNMSLDLKKKQQKDGSFENIFTTALVMQAIFASGTENNMWNIKNAVDFLINTQSEDGSFGNFLNIYFTLPVLYHKSLLNISSSHCKKNLKYKELAHMKDLNYVQNKTIWIKYSLWFGDHLDTVRSLIIRLSENATFIDAMNKAESVDNKYRFEYFISDSKPYIYSISDYQDDPENDHFWFLYKINERDSTYKVINTSPLDVIPKNKEEYVMWYRRNHWTQNDNLLQNIFDSEKSQ